jgi:hypothetical protein
MRDPRPTVEAAGGREYLDKGGLGKPGMSFAP